MATNFKNDLIKELGLEDLPSEEQVEIVLKIGRIIQQNIILRVLDEMKEEDKDEFDKFLGEKGDDQEAITEFLRSKIPNLDDIVNEEIEKFKTEKINFLQEIRKGITG